MKKWGRQKITRELQLRKISAYCIRKAMEEIPEDDYAKTLIQQLDAAMQKYTGDPFVVRSKAATDAWCCIHIYEEFNRLSKADDYELVEF